MKQICAVFLAILLLSLPVCADSLTDPCTSNQSTTTRETYNLASANPIFSMPGYADLADTSALAVQNPAQYGEIVYSVKQVDELSVDLYRKDYASFAVKSPDGSLSYNRLPDKEDQLLDLWIDEQTDLVYCIDDGNYYLLYYMEETGEYLFSKQSDTPQGEGSYHEDTDEETSEEENPEEEPTPFADHYPQGELIPYGLHLLQSFDGKSFEELPVKRVETTLYDQDGIFLFDEQFEAAPSTDCRYLKVQLKQFSRLPYLSEQGMEIISDVNKPYLSMIRQVRCSGPVQPLNPGDGADLPLGEEETDDEEEKEEKEEKKTVSSTKKSSDSTKSSSGGDSRVETTTSTSTSTSSSTTDSNNSTTTYTTNYIFVGSSPESAAALCDILGIEPDALENLQTILGSTNEVLPNSSDSGEEKAAVATVLYQQPVVGLSQQGEDDSASPFGSEEDNDLILYLCITAVAVAAFCVIALFVRKSLAAKKEKTDTDSQEDDFDNL